MTITGVVDAVPERIKHLVYLDGRPPVDGQSFADKVSQNFITKIKQAAEEHGGNLIPVSIGSYPWGVEDKADLIWMDARLTPQPLGVVFTKVSYKDPLALKIPRTFIATRGRSEEKRKEMTERGFHYHEIETGHDAMITAPKEVADMFVSIAG